MALDVSIDLDKLLLLLPQDATPEQKAEWINLTIQEVREAFSNIKADEPFVHLSIIEVHGKFRPTPIFSISCRKCGNRVKSDKSCTACAIIKVRVVPEVKGK